MITIHHLEVQLEVAGDSDQAVFARLFQEYIGRWARRQAEESARRRSLDQERSLSGRQGEGEP